MHENTGVLFALALAIGHSQGANPWQVSFSKSLQSNEQRLICLRTREMKICFETHRLQANDLLNGLQRRGGGSDAFGCAGTGTASDGGRTDWAAEAWAPSKWMLKDPLTLTVCTKTHWRSSCDAGVGGLVATIAEWMPVNQHKCRKQKCVKFCLSLYKKTFSYHHPFSCQNKSATSLWLLWKVVIFGKHKVRWCKQMRVPKNIWFK